ncbi:MAG: hypothetical protein D6731_07025 [Planctomycetota bacterium]|nr:MAG: hypothetical protein D6731_07025 [Planctomycetota bacterium]
MARLPNLQLLNLPRAPEGGEMAGEQRGVEARGIDALTPYALFLLEALRRSEAPLEVDWLLSRLRSFFPPEDQTYVGEGELNPLGEIVSLGLAELLVEGEEEGEEDDDDEEHRLYLLWRTEALEEAADEIAARWASLRPAVRAGLVCAMLAIFGIDSEAPLAEALRALDRRDFLPEEAGPWADVDMPFPICEGMTESALHAVLMTIQAVEPKPGEHVLVCGAKGGYLAALCAHLVGAKGRVVCLDWQEPVRAHVERAFSRYPRLAERVEVRLQGDVTLGAPEDAPFQIVIFNGSIPKIPYPILQQVDDDAGRLLFFLHSGHSSTCYLVRKNREIVEEEKLSEFCFTGIPGAYGFDCMVDLQRQYAESQRNSRRDRPSALRKIKTQVPYPLAKAYMAAFNTSEVMERHTRVLKAYEALIKYLAFPCLSALERERRTDPRLAEYVQAIGYKPSLGHWLGILRDGTRLLGDTEVGAVVAEDHRRRFAQSSVVNAYRMLELQTTGAQKENLRRGVPLGNFLQKLVAYRNKSGEGHGAVASSSTLQKNARLLLEALQVFLLGLRLCSEYVLVHLDGKLEMKSQGRLLSFNVRTFRGCEPERETWERDVTSSEQLPRPGVYLSRDRCESLPLSPWLVFGEGNNGTDLYLYNGRPSKGGDVVYITYHNTDSYPPKWERDRIDEFLSLHPVVQPAEVDPREFAFRTLLEAFLSDGKLSKEEMAVLEQKLPALGLVKGPEEVPDYVRGVVEEINPGVYIET